MDAMEESRRQDRAEFMTFQNLMVAQMQSIRTAITATAAVVPVVAPLVLTAAVPLVVPPAPVLTPILAAPGPVTLPSTLPGPINSGAGVVNGNVSMTPQQLFTYMSQLIHAAPAPEVIVQPATSDTKRMDCASVELIKGLYSASLFDSHFLVMDQDIRTGKIVHYNIPFAIEQMRLKKKRGCLIDADLTDAAIKALILFKFDSGPSGASLHAILGKTAEITTWSEVISSLRIFNHICDVFVNPMLAMFLDKLRNRIEDLRERFPAITVVSWIYIMHSMFASLRSVTAQLQDPNIHLADVLGTIFHISSTSPIFTEISLHTTHAAPSRGTRDETTNNRSNKKSRKNDGGAAGVVIASPSPITQTSKHPVRPPRPVLQGEHPCHRWICNTRPCFTSTTCAVAPKPGDTRGIIKPRPHRFDAIDSAVEATYRAWVLQFDNR
jgi:hypothetical protein